MTDPFSTIEPDGAVQELGGNEPFLLKDRTRVWYVRSGQVDIFSVDVEDGKPVGPRMHVARVPAGEIIMGMDMAESGKGVGLLGVAGIGTAIVPFPRSALHKLAADPSHADAVAVRIENLVKSRLTGLAGKALHPKDYCELERGKEQELKDGETIGVRDELLWITHSEGDLLFLGRDDLPPVERGRFFPLSDRTWLVSSGRTRVRAVDTETFLREDTEWDGLDHLSQLALGHVRGVREQIEQEDRERMDATADVDRQATESAYSQLGSVLAAERDMPLELSEDELLAACQILGHAIGVKVRAHPAKVGSGKQRDPLEAIAKASRLRTRRVLLKEEWYRKDGGPILAFLNENDRPVALLPRSPGRYDLCDPVESTRTHVTASVTDSLKPKGYMFYRTFPDRALTGMDLIRFGLFGCRKDISRILYMGLGAGLLALITPIATGLLFDTVIPGAQTNQLMALVLALSVSAFAVALFHIVRALAILRIEGKMDSSIEAAVWDRLLNLPTPFFRKYTSGDLAMRARGISMIRDMLSGATIVTVLDSVFAFISIGLLFYYSRPLAYVAVGILLVALLVGAACVWVLLQLQKPLFEIQGRLQGLILQFITGMSKLRVAGVEKRAFSSWASRFSKQKQLSYRSRKILAGFAVFTAVLPIVATGLIYARLAFSHDPKLLALTAGKFLAFTAAFMNLLSAVIAMMMTLAPVLMVAPLAQRLKPILQALPEVDVTKAPPGELHGNIEISHVSFRYNQDGPLILRDVSLQIQPGEFVALVGPSGSGKSTLCRLLLGFESPQSGSVFYDEQAITGLDIQALRSQVGVVLQNSKVMPGTIHTNIVGASPLTMDDAWEAVRMVGLEDDVKEMPMGMHTVIPEGGEGLSGGQKQRILLARAIVHKPRILFFDEATSALDNKTQAIVTESLDRLKATRVVIAHRLSTVAHADRIFVLVDGEIVQQGGYEELIKQKGVFADLAKRQLA